MASKAVPSPGNDLMPEVPAMTMPGLVHMFRLRAKMSEDRQVIPAIHDSSSVRLLLPIAGGDLISPTYRGSILGTAGADWATAMEGTDFTRLDARYAIKMDDGPCIFVHSKGVFSFRTPPSGSDRGPLPKNLAQDQVEWFTHITLEAPGGTYNWMNSILAIGAFSQYENIILIDVYRITNFIDQPARSFSIKPAL